jgi:hypothetical protein
MLNDQAVRGTSFVGLDARRTGTARFPLGTGDKDSNGAPVRHSHGSG